MSNGAHDDYLLGAHALDRLDPDESHRARVHIADCGPCRGEAEQLVDARQTLGRIPPEWLVDGPPPSSAPLEAAMKTIRARKATALPRSRRALALAAGLAGLFIGYVIQPAITSAPPVAITSSSPATGQASGAPGGSRSAPSSPGVRQASATDPDTNVSLTATVTAVGGWIRLRVTVAGVPSGEVCRLLVVRHDGSREIAGGWITSRRGETEALVLDGSAAVAPSEVRAVLVENTAGKTFITVLF
jgi:hypothetical protein